MPANSIWLNSNDWLELTLRLVLATLIGGAIGLNRQTKGKAAGLRTHMLVSLGAALFVLLTLMSGSPEPNALSRAVQGVATGVGFLGAGEILRVSHLSSGQPRITGLTSAASIWTTAALGMASACGMWQVSVMGTLLVLLILIGAKWLEQFIPQSHDNDE
jgi:putative Mg2+ transporter-C (MgtC) family protein